MPSLLLLFRRQKLLVELDRADDLVDVNMPYSSTN